MRSLRVGVLLSALLLAGVATARADLALWADVPIVYSFRNAAIQKASPQGLLVGLALPGFLGAGLEAYKVKGQVSNLVTPATDTDYEYRVTMLDVFLDLPFPSATLVLGGGVGQGRFATVPASQSFPDARLLQAYFVVGVPFAQVFDAHVGYHLVRGETDVVGRKANLDANMATVGLKMGF
jgi:hypothetical protein